MDISRPCSRCTKRTLITDSDSGNLICSSCGVVQEFENYHSHLGGISDPTGTYVRVGTAGTGGENNYKQNKIYKAQLLLEDIVFRLGLSPSTSNETKRMIEQITEGEYGQGNWFSIFVGACAYVTMRKNNKSLPITEVADVIGCDIHELGRMVMRVTDFLDLKLPEFDIVNSFERAIRTCPSFSRIENDKIERMLKQGIFLLQCLILWSVTTGRLPVPIVVAVLVFVAQLNQVNHVIIDDVAKELHVRVSTCKLRYKELLKKLVEVGKKVLPWGKNITVKNVLKNAPFVIQYMEMKSMSKKGMDRKQLSASAFDDLVDEVLTQRVDYSNNDYESFDIENKKKNDTESFLEITSPNLNTDDLDRLEISPECLSNIYSEFLDEINGFESTEENRVDDRRENRGFDNIVYGETEWWRGKSELSKKLFLKKILEKNVGFDPMPPSFIKGCLDYEKRKEKIIAAKIRIGLSMNPKESSLKQILCDSGGENENAEKIGKKRKNLKSDINWEDFIIETLILHRVKEDDIMKGHYNTLLDLYVFDSANSFQNSA